MSDSQEMYPPIKNRRVSPEEMRNVGKHWADWVSDKDRWEIISSSKTAFEAIYRLEAAANEAKKRLEKGAK